MQEGEPDPQTMQVYYDADADLSLLAGRTIGVLGYGSQGKAHALNLKDGGLEVLVGLRPSSPSAQTARDAGFEVVSVEEASRRASVIAVLLPDQSQAQAYSEAIGPGLQSGDALVFAHGFNILYGQVTPPDDVDVLMVAPKGVGPFVRRAFLGGGGVPCLLAIHNDATGTARDTGLAYAKGIGGTRAGVLETTFREETETDLFSEQAVLCGGLTELIRAGFDTLVEAGYRPESAYFECLHELKLIVDLIYEGGIDYMRSSISGTAAYGDLTRGKRIITEETRLEMKRMLAEIQDGAFAKEWILENQAGRPVYLSRMRRDREHSIERTGQKLREMMPWLTRG